MRTWVPIGLGAVIGMLVLTRVPFPEQDATVEWIRLQAPHLFYGFKLAYVAMAFTTPYIAGSVLASLIYIFWAKPQSSAIQSVLPPYPDVRRRDKLFLVVGEVHHPKRPEPVQHPHWLEIPHRGMFAGIVIFGAIGSGKTTGCMYPFAEQVLAFCAADPSRRIGGLVLEVKGDFCHKVRDLLIRHGRKSDYVEISLDTPYRYNPLYNDLDAYTLAYGIASLLNNLFGKGKEPFWQQAYTNLVKFVILLHQVLYDYVTLFDVYQGVINPELLEEKIKEGERREWPEVVSIGFDEFIRVRELESFPFERDPDANQMKAPSSEDLLRTLRTHNVAFESRLEAPPNTSGAPPWSELKRDQFAAVKRWFRLDWLRMDQRLRTSIVEGISVFLSLFDDNPAVKRVFCPPKETYDPVANADGRYGVPLPPFAELIERGQVCALNFPAAANPGLARTIGTLMKQDYQRAVLGRIPRMERESSRHFRETLFICDEYHSFATAGESDPSGDEKFFALARQAKCISIVATQSISSLRSTLPGESWRTLLQTFRTKIFLALSDDFSARTASEMCGKEEQLKPNYSLSEHGQDAAVSVFTGKAIAQKSSVGTTKGYSVQRDFVFEPKVFAELRNAQAIVLAYDGLNPRPPTYCYLKPYYLNPSTSYFEQLAQGAL